MTESAGTYMQISDLCKSCSKQNFCGNGMTNHYCTGYAPITYQYHTDIKIPPFDAEVELDKLYPTEQTNEEWFCGLPTTEKSEFLSTMAKEAIEVHEKHGITWHEAVSWWDGWLKQPHTIKE